MSKLREAMAALEALQELTDVEPTVHRAALAGLGSKFLAVGAPGSLGLAQSGADAPALLECHTLLFGPMELRCAGDNAIESGPGIRMCSMEESFACDIVCLATTTEFSRDWIPEATHLNIVDTGPWSSGMQALAREASMTWVGSPRHPLLNSHGDLAAVIEGRVSGRMGEELTGLLWTPPAAVP